MLGVLLLALLVSRFRLRGRLWLADPARASLSGAVLAVSAGGAGATRGIAVASRAGVFLVSCFLSDGESGEEN